MSNIQVISLGDTIKFSLSPTKTRDRLSTNVPGVPLDDRNLVCQIANVIYLVYFSCTSCNIVGLVSLFLCLNFFYLVIPDGNAKHSTSYIGSLSYTLQIIKALNLYRKKTSTDNFFWVSFY